MNKINQIVNEVILDSSEVQTRIMTPKEAVKMGALALFGKIWGRSKSCFYGKRS